MGKKIGLDLGSKSLGIAISDSRGIIATGVENYLFRDGDLDSALKRVDFYCKRDNIIEGCIGLPLHMSGDESERSAITRLFATRLEEELHLKMTLIDERWSTVIANKRMLEGNLSAKKRGKSIDRMSAVVILETYLERN